MKKYQAKRLIRLEDYSTGGNQSEAKYGLPSKVKFCKKCVISNQRPNSALEYQQTINTKKSTINFDESGVCDACRMHEKKHQEVDWDDREKQLKALCNKYRSKDGSYDCLVPGSGGKDSFYAAHKLKYKYGMHPLTITWAPHIYTDWGWKNFQAWIHAGFDNFLFTPSGRVHRLLTRLAFENLLHPFQPFIIGQKTFAPKMAILHDIKLVFYGENEAEYGNPLQDNTSAKRDYSYFSAADKSKVLISGTPVSDLKKYFALSDYDLSCYLPANPAQLQRHGIEVHYLGYYLMWHPQGAYYYAVENGGFLPADERNAGSYSKYNSIDDRMDDFHFYTYFTKFGIGRATYDASQEIRNNEITREEGVALVKKFDGEFPKRFAEEVFRYLSIPEKEFPTAHLMFEKPVMDYDYFMNVLDTFRSPHLWKYENDKWSLRHAVHHPNH